MSKELAIRPKPLGDLRLEFQKHVEQWRLILFRAVLNNNLERTNSVIKFANNPAIKPLLEKYGIDLLNAENGQGAGTALHYAASGSYVEIIESLLKAGADVNAKDDDDATPLHDACDYNTTPPQPPPVRIKAVQALLKAGADINAQTKKGDTPLHRASKYSYDYLVDTLMADENIRPGITNEEGKTAFDIRGDKTDEQPVRMDSAERSQLEAASGVFLLSGARGLIETMGLGEKPEEPTEENTSWSLETNLV